MMVNKIPREDVVQNVFAGFLRTAVHSSRERRLKSDESCPYGLNLEVDIGLQ
jgi:hypothetical protein